MIYIYKTWRKILAHMGNNIVPMKEMYKAFGVCGPESKKQITSLVQHGYIKEIESETGIFYQRTGRMRLPVLSKKGAPVVYFIESDHNGLIKIGFTTDLETRFRLLLNSSPAKLKLLNFMQSDEIGERKLHGKFKDCRSHAEWFHPAPELLEYIDSLPQMEMVTI